MKIIQALGGRKSVVTLLLVTLASILAALGRLDDTMGNILLTALAAFNIGNAAEHLAGRSKTDV